MTHLSMTHLFSDPVERLLYHIKHCRRSQYKQCQGLTVSSIIDQIKSYANQINSSHVFDRKYSTSGSDLHIGFQNYIDLGNYYSIIRDYNSIFNQSRDGNQSRGHPVHVVDGEQILINPNQEYKILLDYFNLDFKSINFKFNLYKGFYCLEKPIKFCLGEK